jgi:hypothetical protein
MSAALLILRSIGRLAFFAAKTAAKKRVRRQAGNIILGGMLTEKAIRRAIQRKRL